MSNTYLPKGKSRALMLQHAWQAEYVQSKRSPHASALLACLVHALMQQALESLVARSMCYPDRAACASACQLALLSVSLTMYAAFPAGD